MVNENAQEWLESNYPESGRKFTDSFGRTIYVPPRDRIEELDIINKNLEGKLVLKRIWQLKKVWLSR